MDSMNAPINATEGMLYHIIKKIRPELAKQIQKSNRLESAVFIGEAGLETTRPSWKSTEGQV